MTFVARELSMDQSYYMLLYNYCQYSMLYSFKYSISPDILESNHARKTLRSAMYGRLIPRRFNFY